jgi:hypothetical protein
VFDPEGPGKVACYLRETHGPPKLPEGYRLEFSADPDAPALRRPDGTVVARFAVRGMTHEALEREALEDLLHTSRKPGGEDPKSLEALRRPRPTQYSFVESPSWRTSSQYLPTKPISLVLIFSNA